MWLRKKGKKKKVLCWLYVWCGAGVEQNFFFFSKLMKKKKKGIREMLSLKYLYSKF